MADGTHPPVVSLKGQVSDEEWRLRVDLAALYRLAWLNGWASSAAGWTPFLFLAAVPLGFSVWEGSLFGLQRPNAAFRRFAERLHEGKHLFFVDVSPAQEPILNRTLAQHPRLELAGTGQASPAWAIALQHRLHRLRKMM